MKDLLWIIFTLIYGAIMIIPAEGEYQKRLEKRKEEAKYRYVSKHEVMDYGPLPFGLGLTFMFFTPSWAFMRDAGIEPWLCALLCASGYTYLGIFGRKIHD